MNQLKVSKNNSGRRPWKDFLAFIRFCFMLLWVYCSDDAGASIMFHFEKREGEENKVVVYICLKILFQAYNITIKSITRSLIIFKKPRKMIDDFFSHYIFVRTFQWTSSECLTNVTITVKVAMVKYIHCENG